MKTSRKGFYQVSAIVVFVIASLLIGFIIWREKTNDLVLISEEQAILNAIQACNPGYGLQPMEPPTETKAELTTLGKAGGYPFSNPERPVWVVTMKGRWLLVGGPAPDPTSISEPSYWNVCVMIIDAQTGESLSTAIE